MKNTFLSLSILFLFFGSANSQTYNTIEILRDSGNNNHELSLKIESTSFFKNNEYFNDFSKGFTGIGFFFKPTIEYFLAPKTKLSAGIFLLKYSGMDNFAQAIPLFTVQHKLTKNLDLVFGSIYGTLNHKLEEPLFRFDEYYQNNVEYGLQFLYNTSLIESDLWLSWEKFIFKDSPFQEELVIGNTTQLKAFQSNTFNLSIPFQILIFHKGGQIDSSPDPMSSIINGSAGLNIDYSIDKMNSIGFEPLVFLYQGWNLPESGVNSQLFNNGKALYLKLNYRNKYFNTMFGYWSSNKFIAPRGEYLFQSISEWDEGFSQAERKLITGKITIDRKISESFFIAFKADGYYDILNKDFAYSYGFYLVIKESFFLKKIKLPN